MPRQYRTLSEQYAGFLAKRDLLTDAQIKLRHQKDYIWQAIFWRVNDIVGEFGFLGLDDAAERYQDFTANPQLQELSRAFSVWRTQIVAVISQNLATITTPITQAQGAFASQTIADEHALEDYMDALMSKIPAIDVDLQITV